MSKRTMRSQQFIYVAKQSLLNHRPNPRKEPVFVDLDLDDDGKVALRDHRKIDKRIYPKGPFMMFPTEHGNLPGGGQIACEVNLFRTLKQAKAVGHHGASTY